MCLSELFGFCLIVLLRLSTLRSTLKAVSRAWKATCIIKMPWRLKERPCSHCTPPPFYPFLGHCDGEGMLYEHMLSFWKTAGPPSPPPLSLPISHFVKAMYDIISLQWSKPNIHFLITWGCVLTDSSRISVFPHIISKSRHGHNHIPQNFKRMCQRKTSCFSLIYRLIFFTSALRCMIFIHSVKFVPLYPLWLGNLTYIDTCAYVEDLLEVFHDWQ